MDGDSGDSEAEGSSTAGGSVPRRRVLELSGTSVIFLSGCTRFDFAQGAGGGGYGATGYGRGGYGG